ncbi:MAG: hypothetical protein ACOX4L_00005, partial [Bacillota bacterium]
RILASAGMGFTAMGLFIFSFLSQTTPVWLVIINLALMGLGFALFSSPNTNAVMSAVEKRFYGIASSTLGTMRLTGQAISMAVVTLIINIVCRQRTINPGQRRGTGHCYEGILRIVGRTVCGRNFRFPSPG